MESEAYQQGVAAFEDDYNISRCDYQSDCPYDELQPEAAEWRRGYQESYETCELFGGFSY